MAKIPVKKTRTDKSAEALVCVGAFVGAHGVRGLVKLKSYTQDPGAVLTYGPLLDADGRGFTVRARGAAQSVLLVDVEGVGDRDAARALRGVRLHVPRTSLPPPEKEEFYRADLIGLAVWLREPDGSEREIGAVRGVHDFGAGDMLEIAPSPESGLRAADLVAPFTKQAVPVVDIESGRVVFAPPAGQLSPVGGRADGVGGAGGENG